MQIVAGHAAWEYNRRQQARALYCEGLILFFQANYPDARNSLEESATIARAIGDNLLITDSLCILGNVAQAQGDIDIARAFSAESLARARRANDSFRIAEALQTLGDIELGLNHFDEAEELFEESAAGYRLAGEKLALAVNLRRLGQIALVHGDHERAWAPIRESMTINIEAKDKRGIAACLTSCAAIALAQGRMSDAIKLCGAGNALIESIHTGLYLLDRDLYERILEALHSQLDRAAFDAAWAEGRAMTMEQAVALALEEHHG